MNLLEMPIEELKKKIEIIKNNLNEKELKAFHSGIEMIDNAILLDKNETKETLLALITYTVLKEKEINIFTLEDNYIKKFIKAFQNIFD